MKEFIMVWMYGLGVGDIHAWSMLISSVSLMISILALLIVI